LVVRWGDGGDGLSLDALEDARKTLTVENRTEPGEEPPGLWRHETVNRLNDPRAADRLGQRRGSTPSDRAGHEPDQHRGREDGSHGTQDGVGHPNGFGPELAAQPGTSAEATR